MITPIQQTNKYTRQAQLGSAETNGHNHIEGTILEVLVDHNLAVSGAHGSRNLGVVDFNKVLPRDTQCFGQEADVDLSVLQGDG